MQDKMRFFLMRMSEKLWIKPLIVCLLSIAAAFIALSVDQLESFQHIPDVKPSSIEMLLEVISASMLVMAVFAVGSMLAAYQSASNSATPRSFSLVVADDVSQNALSTFIGAFIFSIVAQVALINGYYGNAGRFLLFIITILVFVLVIFSFIKWVDAIARLGRVGTIIAKVESATAEALLRRKNAPFFGGKQSQGVAQGLPVFSPAVGYIQRIDMQVLQNAAEQADIQLDVRSLPGKFITPDQPLMYLVGASEQATQLFDDELLEKAFRIGTNRTFDDDPRFGLITLSEIGSRALSPAVNDPGTAIEIVGIFVRLFCQLTDNSTDEEPPTVEYERVAVPPIPLNDLFEDAFNAIARDGAATLEVVIRLLKAQLTLRTRGDKKMAESAQQTAQYIIAHAEKALLLETDIIKMQAVGKF